MAAARVLTRAVSRSLPLLARRPLVPTTVFATRCFGSSAGDEESSSSSWAHEWVAAVEGPELKPLPELPDVEPYPTPLLTQDDISEYVLPLYARGWYVTTKARHRALARRLRFKAYAHLVDFFSDLSKLVIAEGHHPYISCGYRDFLVETTTHSARIGYTGVTSGPTLRDVRLAMLVEGLRDAYASDNRLFLERARPPPARRPRTAARLHAASSKLISGGTAPSRPTPVPRRRLSDPCMICMSHEHLSRECPDRYTATPRTSCTLCGGDHFAINCPKVGDPTVKPLTPCKTCGDLHWSSQCPHKIQLKPAQPAA